MRRVRNHRNHSSNPALMFARGVESMVSDHLHHPGKFDQKELHEKSLVSKKQDVHGNLFSILMRQFANY